MAQASPPPHEELPPSSRPSSSSPPPPLPARRSAPPAQHPAPPTLPKIDIPPSQILPLVPWSVVEKYALSSFPEEILSLRPEYQRLVEDGTIPSITQFPKWLFEWCMIIELAAIGTLWRDDDQDRAALREYEAYRLAAEAFPAEFDEEVVRQAQEEEEVIKDRIWLRWERLLGIHHAGTELPCDELPLPGVRLPPPGVARRVSPFAFDHYGKRGEARGIITPDPHNQELVALYTFPDPVSSPTHAHETAQEGTVREARRRGWKVEEDV